jgi:hypothetical protein
MIYSSSFLATYYCLLSSVADDLATAFCYCGSLSLKLLGLLFAGTERPGCVITATIVCFTTQKLCAVISFPLSLSLWPIKERRSSYILYTAHILQISSFLSANNSSVNPKIDYLGNAHWISHSSQIRTNC